MSCRRIKLGTNLTLRLKNSLVSSTKHSAPTEIQSNDSHISWYSCGPTVYDAAHIGHARTYVCTDIIRRILTDIHHKDVNFAMGITDIDDKIIERAASNGLPDWLATERMVRGLENDFFDDLDSLNVRRPNAVLRVTEHIQEIIQYIEKILLAGSSYITPDGVYFSVASCGDSYLQFRESSAVSNDLSGLETTETIKTDPSAGSLTNDVSNLASDLKGYKKDNRDFALWKSVKLGEPSWDSPWGPGRPGWHIECSAITHSYFGPKLDIHSGGIDLQFPHHTNEIAQCASHNCSRPSEWVKFWIHTGHLYIEGRKMSKSLKNFISIKDYMQGSYSTHPAIDFRIFCLQNKYHSSVHFSQSRVDEAGAFRRKIENYLKLSAAVLSPTTSDPINGVAEESNTSSSKIPAAMSCKPTSESKAIGASLSDCQHSVQIALANDFDTPEALKLLSYLVGDAMKYASLVALSRTSVNAVCSDLPSDVHTTVSITAVVNRSTQQPVEPLLAVSNYLRDLLGKLGVDLDHSHERSRLTSSSLPSGPGVLSAGEAIILDSLLDFRSKVRSSSLNCMKSLKTEIKNSGRSSKDVDPIVSIARGALGEVLGACDSVRDSMKSQVGVHIEDVSDTVCIWRSAASSQVTDDKPTQI